MKAIPIAGRVIRSAIAVFVILGFFEGVLHLFGLPSDGLYQGDVGYYWTLSPDYSGDIPHGEGSFRVEISELGIRDEGPPENGPWVLALGCSTTFGWGVEADEVWTEILESQLRIPVVNAGVPGHSTAQGVEFSRELLTMKPDIVVLGWGVRDSQLAPTPDSNATPSSLMSQIRIVRLLRKLVDSRGKETLQQESQVVARVSPEEFAQNMADIHMIASTNDIAVVDLAFPMLDYPESYYRELEGLDGLFLDPQLPDSSFFEFDTVHLTSEGHQRLAAFLERPIMGLLELQGEGE
jgi:lysophospholipase L1-like esterase